MWKGYHPLASHSVVWTASRNCLLLRLKPRSWKGRTVSPADDPFSAARFSARLVLQGAISLIRSVLFSSSFDLSVVTACCADFTRQSSGSSCDWDTICSTSGVVTLTEEGYSRLASRYGFPKPRPPRRTGNARMVLSSWLHLRSVITEMSPWDIAFSSGSSRSWMSGRVLKKYVHRCFKPKV